MENYHDSFGHEPDPEGAATDEPASSASAGGRALVPVQRHDGFTPKRRRKFLKALRKTGCVQAACRKAKISDSAAYKTRRRDAEFRAMWKSALSLRGTDLELVAWRFGVEGVEEEVVAYGKPAGVRIRRDPQLFRMLLRASDPERYGGQGVNRKALEKKIRKEMEAAQEPEHHPDEMEMVRRRILRKLKKVRQRSIDAGTHYEEEGGSLIPVNYVKDPNIPPPPPRVSRPYVADPGPESELPPNFGEDGAGAEDARKSSDYRDSGTESR